MYIKEILMKRIILLPIVVTLFIGCVTTTENSVEKDQSHSASIAPDQIVTDFELTYYDLVQFDDKGGYDKEATEAALEMLFTHHPLIKDLRYMTPKGEVAANNPYYNPSSEDVLVLFDGKNVAPVTSRRIGFMMFRYRTITYINVEVKTAGGTSGMSSESNFAFENPEDVVAGSLSREMNSRNTYDVINFDSLEVGELTVVNDPGISKYAFTYYVPESASRDKLLKIAYLGHGGMEEDYNHMVDNRGGMNTPVWIDLAEEFGYAFVTVWTPQRAQYLSRASMIPGEIENDFWARPDLEYVKVINALADMLDTEGFKTHRKVYMTGFSNGGAQSNVFPVMHPEYVEATAPGGSGQYLLPLEEIDGYEFTWPIGLADAEKIEGWDFNDEEFRTVEYFVFDGAEDMGDPAKDLDFLSLLPDREVFYKEVLGEFPYQRPETFSNYLTEFGNKATYKLEEGIGHDMTNEMRREVFEFFESIPVK